MDNSLDQLGVLTLGSRLRRLTDMVYKQADEIYQLSGLDFQASWFPILFLLADRESMSVTEMAEEMRQTHSAVSQLVKKLVARGYVQRFGDADDRRRSELVLTEAGGALVVRLQPVWGRIMDVLTDMVRQSGYDLLSSLDAFEEQMVRRDFVSEVMQRPKRR